MTLSELPLAVPPIPPDRESSVIVVDKPKGLSSFGVIRALRRILGVKKIGHAGTLDPMATGVLICLVGKPTKLSDAFMGQPKVYSGTITLGGITPSYDAETPVEPVRNPAFLSEAQLQAAATSFLGTLQQVPPMYAAIKQNGVPLYKKARKGEVVERAPRTVTLTRFDLTSISLPDVSFEIACSKGTYIRSIAHDFGHQLGVGGYLSSLRREAIGEFTLHHAWTLDVLRDTFASRTEDAA